MQAFSESMARMRSQTQSKNPMVRRMRKSFSDPFRLRGAIRSEFRNNRKALGQSAWDVIVSIMSYLKDNHVKKGLDEYGACICDIVRTSAPKEVYIGVLEQYDPSTDSRYVEMLMPALDMVLTKYIDVEPDSCALSFETTLSTLLYYFDSFNLPNYNDYEPYHEYEENYDNVKCVTFVEKFSDVIRPAITELLKCKRKIRKIERLKAFSLQFTCHLIMKMMRFDVNIPDIKGHAIEWNPSDGSDEEFKYTACHRVCHELVGLTMQVFSIPFLWDVTDWVRLHPPDSFINPEIMPEVSKQILRGRAGFFYLILQRGIEYAKFPKVYSPLGLFARTVAEVNALLSCHSPIVMWKGFELLSYVVERIEKSSLSYGELQYCGIHDYSGIHCIKEPKNALRELFDNLGITTTIINSLTFRAKAVELYRKVLDLFQWRDKIQILTYLFKTVKHSGMLGVLITYLKDRLDEVLRDNAPEGSVVFCDRRRMQTVGGIIFSLPEGINTDLLQNCDRLMTGLNLLRFLLIRDKANRTGLFDNLSRIQDLFVKTIRLDIEITRETYANELLSYVDAKKPRRPEQSKFVVNGYSLMTFPLEDQMKTLKAALHTFDMMEVVAVRVEELIKELAEKK